MESRINQIVEGEFYTGLIPERLSILDYVFQAAGNEEYDWNQNYNVQTELEEVLGASYRLTPYNQLQTLSCTAQGWAKYVSVLASFAYAKEMEVSRKDIYSHTRLAYGGSYTRLGADRLRSKGFSLERFVPSYPMTEDHLKIIEKGEDGVSVDFLRLFKDSQTAIVWPEIDKIAAAIKQNMGVLLSFGGKNDGSWFTSFPNSPETVDEVEWLHLSYAFAAAKISNKKFIGIINSWGPDIGDNGIQWLGEEHFKYSTMSPAYTIIQPNADYSVKNLGLFQQIQKYITDNSVKWVGDKEWRAIKDRFQTDLSRSSYYDYLQAEKYLLR